MRLSEVKGERAFEVIAEIIDPIANIAEDESVTAIFKREPANGRTPAQVFLGKLKKAVPVVAREHKEDVVRILAAVGDTTPEQYMSGCTLASLTADVFSLMTDEEFLAFLPSATEAGSGTSSASTEGTSQSEPSESGQSTATGA